MKVKKHANSRMRRRSKGRTGRKRDRRCLTKTRRMRGRGWWNLFSGSAAQYSPVAQTEETEFAENAEITDSTGKKGKYTGHVTMLEGMAFANDQNAIVDYEDGSKYIGGFDKNMRHGKGVLHAKESVIIDGTSYNFDTILEGNWENDAPTDTVTKKYYNENGEELNPYSPEYIKKIKRQHTLADLSAKSNQLDKYLSKMPQKPVSQPPPPSVQTPKFNYVMSTAQRRKLIDETRRDVIDRFDPSKI
jgi:hypothetical protein